MPAIEVRPLRPGQEGVWLGLNISRTAVAASLPDITRRLRCHGADERAFLLAFDGERCVGRLEGVFLTPRLYLLREVHAADDPGACDVQNALCGYLRPSFAKDGITVLTWDTETSRALNDALARSGFEVAKRKVFVERRLEGYRSPHSDPFAYRPLSLVGRRRFVRVMAEASEGDPFEDDADRDVEREFQDLVDHAGRSFDPSWWQIATLEDEAVGVVLPQAYPERPDEGTLFYVGVRPAFRGRGYGRVLHAAGLAFLSRHGVTKYMGSTDERNAPMIAVFRTNGCARTGTQLFLRARSD